MIGSAQGTLLSKMQLSEKIFLKHAKCRDEFMNSMPYSYIIWAQDIAMCFKFKF